MNASGVPFSGYLYDLQNELATRGQFKFEYILLPSKPKYLSWTAELAQSLAHIDIFGNDVYADTIERRVAGLGFPAAIGDKSLVLIAQLSLVSASDVWSFLQPFSNNLWAVLFAICIVNGVALWIVNGDLQSFSIFSIVHSIYISFATFTGGTDLVAEKPAANVLNVGFSFFVLLVISTYTANLASFLINQQTPLTKVTSIDDANSKGYTICVLAGSAAASVLSSSYPKIQIVAFSGTIPQMLSAMRTSGACVGSVLGYTDWQYSQVRVESNPDCDLVMIDKPFRKLGGSWPYHTDYSNKCTSVIDMVLSSLIVDITADGTLDTIWQNSLSETANVDCSSSPYYGLSSSTSASQYGVDSLAGVIYIYVACLVIALLMRLREAAWSYYSKRRTQQEHAGDLHGVGVAGDDTEGRAAAEATEIDFANAYKPLEITR